MKLKTNDVPLEMGGVQVEGEFRIRNSAKAFSILSSGLYSDKIQAILRELGCNAYDSHVEAGKADVPFTVHLPTTLNPQFYVRDYGIGLDHEGVTKLYTTYFESTKQDSNDYVGCLGLGSKSPFSYTRNFTVTAIKNGMERIYNCFINENGIPSVALLNEKATDACNGVEVRFAVHNHSDMNEFAATAQKVYRWFKTKPEITGNVITIPNVDYRERDIAPGVHLAETRSLVGQWGHSRSYALMGNVAYPINLPGNNSDKLVQDLLSRSCYVMEFGIGELGVAASREELSYDDATVNAIRSKVGELIAGAVRYIETETSKLATNWEKACKILNIIRQDRTLFHPAALQFLQTAPPTLKNMVDISTWSERLTMTLHKDEMDGDEVRVSLYSVGTVGPDEEVRLRNNPSFSQDYTTRLRSVTVDPETIFIVQNDKGNLLGRIRKACDDGVLGLSTWCSIAVVRRMRKSGNTQPMWEKISGMLGNPPVIFSDTLPEMERASKTKNDEVKAYTFEKTRIGGRWGHDGYRLRSGPKKMSSFKKVDGKVVYLPLHGKQAKWGEQVISVSELLATMHRDGASLFDLVNTDGVDKVLPMNVYGVNGLSLKIAESSDEWVSLYDLFVERLNKMDWDALEKNVDSTTKMTVLASCSRLSLVMTGGKAPTMLDYEHPTSPYGRIAAMARSLKATKNESMQLERMQRAMVHLPQYEGKIKEIDDRRRAAEKETQELVGEVLKTYSMLGHISDYADRQKYGPALREYVEAIDKLKF